MLIHVPFQYFNYGCTCAYNFGICPKYLQIPGAQQRPLRRTTSPRRPFVNFSRCRQRLVPGEFLGPNGWEAKTVVQVFSVDCGCWPECIRLFNGKPVAHPVRPCVSDRVPGPGHSAPHPSKLHRFGPRCRRGAGCEATHGAAERCEASRLCGSAPGDVPGFVAGRGVHQHGTC